MRDINLLAASFKPLAIELVTRLDNDLIWKAGGYKPLILETARELAVQMAYFSRSRMTVPHVQAMFKAAKLWQISEEEARSASTWTLDSKHISGHAIDIAPSLDGKTPDWKATLTIWKRIGYHASALGLKWGGDWKTADNPHVEIRG